MKGRGYVIQNGNQGVTHKGGYRAARAAKNLSRARFVPVSTVTISSEQMKIQTANNAQSRAAMHTDSCIIAIHSIRYNLRSRLQSSTTSKDASPFYTINIILNQSIFSAL